MVKSNNVITLSNRNNTGGLQAPGGRRGGGDVPKAWVRVLANALPARKRRQPARKNIRLHNDARNNPPARRLEASQDNFRAVSPGSFWSLARSEGSGPARTVDFPTGKMARGIGGRLNRSFEESRNGEVRAASIQLHLEGDEHRAFRVNYERCVKRVKGSLRLLFTLVRRGRIRGSRDPGLDKLRDKIKAEHEAVVGQIKKLKEDGGDNMGKIKGKILLPLRKQLEHCYEITGERKGGWK